MSLHFFQDSPVLPHKSGAPDLFWVTPQKGKAVAAPTDAFKVLMPSLMQIYSKLPNGDMVTWISLPSHVEVSVTNRSNISW